jgi:hypothetical protein
MHRIPDPDPQHCWSHVAEPFFVFVIEKVHKIVHPKFAKASYEDDEEDSSDGGHEDPLSLEPQVVKEVKAESLINEAVVPFGGVQLKAEQLPEADPLDGGPPAGERRKSKARRRCSLCQSLAKDRKAAANLTKVS